MTKSERKLRRAQPPPGSASSRKRSKGQLQAGPPSEMPEALRPENMRALWLRAGIPVAGVWLLGLLIFAVSQSSVAQGFALGVPVVITLAVLGVFLWASRQAGKVRGVAAILAQAQDAEGREGALKRLEAEYKSQDPAAVFAKAQLVMQEKPEEALRILETLDLAKVPAAVADQARAQRGMVHLMLGQINDARDLADGIDLSRQRDLLGRAFMVTVIAEAWARTGQAKKAAEQLEKVDVNDASLAQLRPQLLRAQAFVAAATSDLNGMRNALHRLSLIDARLLAGFLGKKTHPLLQKEAKKMFERSGLMPRKMQIQRRP